MFGLGTATRIYVATGHTDMRLGFNGLYGLVCNRLQCDPLSGHLFLFANSRRDRMKILFFDGSGLWVCSKQSSEDRIQLSREEFALLVGGIDLVQARKRKWYRRAVGQESSLSRKTA
jgi:transposase